MCGICGSTRRDGLAAVSAMNRAMVRRGPDDEGVYTDPSAGVTLGVRRLSVIDVEGGHQPLSTPDAAVWAVLNGEIYNHPTLQADLRRRGHRLRTGSDTEVLVHLYEEYGVDLVHALEGMFAFALWDAQQQRLLIARDRFGEKPLFFARCGADLVFASELNVLEIGAGAPWTVDPCAVDEVFRYGYVAGPRTMVREAEQLPAAHRLVWSRESGQLRMDRYWGLPAPPDRTTTSTETLVAEAERLLASSVSARLIADVPRGVLLSGGVDSTIVAALAARSSTQPIRTFTVGYDTGEVSEVAAARRVADYLGADHTEVLLSSDDVAARVPAVLAALDQPIADQALVAAHCVSEAARRSVTVAVGGEGADELFGGYPRYSWLARGDAIDRLVPPPVARLAAAGLTRLRLPGRLHRLPEVVQPSSTLARHLRWVSDGRGDLVDSMYGQRLTEDLTRALPVSPSLLGGRDVLASLMAFDQDRWLPDDVLAKADRASMLVSLEVRTPYLSRELAEFAASVPSRVHVRGGGKSLLRAVLRRLAPAPLRARGKTAFRVPAADWLRGPLLPTLREVTGGGRLVHEGWFDGAVLAQLVGEHAAGTHDHSAALWPVMTLALWLEGTPAS